MNNLESFFISDLHLSQNFPRTIVLFLEFLKTKALEVDNLYILGDFFEAWAGDDLASLADDQIIQALKAYHTTGRKIFFMPGNRDFLVGKHFAQQSGCTLLPDPYVIQIDNQNILLMHGDSLCTFDKKYQRFRAVARNALIKKIFLYLPAKLRLAVAKKLRAPSKNTMISEAQKKIFDVNLSTVTEKMLHYNAHVLIHGHTHKPIKESITLNQSDKLGQRIVLGEWLADSGCYLHYTNHQFELSSYRLT